MKSKVEQTIKEAGAFIRAEAGKVSVQQIEHKSLNNLVSYVDKTAEEMLVKGLSEALPDSVFLTEEATVEQGEGEWRWIIDPLDGTTNFLHGIPLFSVSVALEHQGEIVMGWVYDIMHDGLYFAEKGKGAFRNGKPISVSAQDNIEYALSVTGFPYGKPEVVEAYMNILLYLTHETRGVRRLGSAAIDLAYVAEGKFEAFYEYKLNAWDVAAGSLIVQEAGGIITDFSGGDNYLFGRQIIATNGKITKDLMEVIKTHFLDKIL